MSKKYDPVFTFNAGKSSVTGTPAPSISTQPHRDYVAVEFGTPKVKGRFPSPIKSLKPCALSPKMIKKVKDLVTPIAEAELKEQKKDISKPSFDVKRASIDRMSRFNRRSNVSEVEEIYFKSLKKRSKDVAEPQELLSDQSSLDEIVIHESMSIEPKKTRVFRIVEGDIELTLGSKKWTARSGAELTLCPGNTYKLVCLNCENAVLSERA